MTYTDALAYIHKVSWRGSKPGLSRISELCRRLEYPQDKLRFIHVAGTNGKGSFCSMLSSVLIAAGYKTGTFTSPYIVRFNDRMCINGNEISDRELAELVEEVIPIAESMDDKPTEFELITAIGLLWFLRNNCDIVVLEAGMGGRFDSTNVVKNTLLSVITGIDYDHMGILGDTLEKIAWEKAGIIKACPVLVGEVSGGALEVIKNEAAEKNVSVTVNDYSKLTVREQTLSGTVFDFGTHKDIKIKLLGNYQPKNASLVLSAVDILRQQLDISEQNVKDGMANAIWHARFEILSYEHMIIYDGGHNMQGVRQCIESVKKYFDGGVNLVTGVMKDKAYTEMAKTFAEVCKTVTTLTPDNPRALPANEFAEVFKKLGIPATHEKSERAAIEAALDKQKQNGLPLLCAGSLYMYEKLAAEVKAVLHAE